MKNIAIIYHDADFDGKLSNEVCRFHLKRLHPDAAIHSYGWDYGRPTPISRLTYQLDSNPNEPIRATWSDYDAIYIVDLSVDELMVRPELRDKIVWIDHHKSAIEKWCISDKPDGNQHGQFVGLRIDGVAACRLCWAWFTWGKLPKGVLPSKQDYRPPLTKEVFVSRQIREPQLIRLAGEYDIWDHRDPDGKALQFGLHALSGEAFADLVDEEFHASTTFLDPRPTPRLCDAIAHGHAIKSYCDRRNDEYSATYARTLEWEGLKFCCLNIGQRGNSDLLRGGIKPEHQACFAWRHTGDGVMVSLYHIEGHTDLDLSKIAVKYGGGGHKGACGFRVTLKQLDEILGGAR